MSLYPTPRPMTVEDIPDGDAGIAATLRKMVELARQGKRDPGVIEVANSLVRDVPQGDRLGEVKALHAFVRDHIRYTNDIGGIEPVELLRTCEATLTMGCGDCDDKSILLAALLCSIGRPARIVAVALRPSRHFSHVLVETPRGKGWMPLETILDVEAGWGPLNVSRRMIVYV